MVSLHEETLPSKKREIRICGGEFHSSSKKRKEEDQTQGGDQNILLSKRTKSENARSIMFDFELHLSTNLPLDWHGRLNTKVRSRTSEDHRTQLEEPASPGGHKMSLDLELNLSPSGSPKKNDTKNDQPSNHDDSRSSKGDTFMSSGKKNANRIGLSRSPSWLAFEGDDDDDDDSQKKRQEMVPTVCMKCHMLVMLCKSAPVCPNCKFTHPHDHSSTNLFKPSRLLSLLC